MISLVEEPFSPCNFTVQRTFQSIYHGMLALFIGGMVWSFWASAQPTPGQGASPGQLRGGASTNLSTTATGIRPMQEVHLTFGLDEYAFLRENSVFEIPLWQYVASLLFILVAFLSARVLGFIIGGWVKRWAGKTKTKTDDLLIDLLHGPVKLIAFVVFLHVGLTLFDWPKPVETFLVRMLVILVAISFTRMLTKIVDLFMVSWSESADKEEDRAFDKLVFPIIRKSLKVFVVLVSVLLTSSNLGVDITGVIASLSIGGLAIGLAAQDTLANLFGAVAIFMDKPFRLGDHIKLDSLEGNVESIGMRSTRIRSLEGHLITVPNKTMGTAIITNVSRRPNIKTTLIFGLTYDTPSEHLKRALEILQSIYEDHPRTFEARITFHRFADSSLNIEVVHWWNGTDHKSYLLDLQEMNLAVKERFDSERINFAFPTQTVYLKQDKTT